MDQNPSPLLYEPEWVKKLRKVADSGEKYIDKHGRIVDVLVEEYWTFPNDPDKTRFAWLYVFADPGYEKIIAAVPGVTRVDRGDNHYDAYLDPRYDREFIAKEIEAAILCNDPTP